MTLSMPWTSSRRASRSPAGPAPMMPTWVRWRFDTCLNLRSTILGGNLLVDKTNVPLGLSDRTARRSGAARALPRSHRPVTIFESFETFENAFTAPRRCPNMQATALDATTRRGVEGTMNHRMGAWRRRRVLGGLIGASAALAAPAILRAAPSGAPVKVGGTLSLTGFLAQTAVIHKIAAEIMIEDINSRNGFLGRPVEYILLDDQSKPDVARSL